MKTEVPLEQVGQPLLQGEAGKRSEQAFPQATISTSCNSLQLLAIQIPNAAGNHICNFL